MASRRHRIMVVDDEEDVRTLLKMALGQQYEVFVANNGLDAQLKLERYEPDLAIVDIMMPLMDGHALARKIRITPTFEDMPIMMLSALNAKEDIKGGYESGANMYLTKPFQADRVLRNVDLQLRGVPVRPKTMTIEEVEEADRRHEQKLRRALERSRSSTKVQKLSAVGSSGPAVDQPEYVTPESKPSEEIDASPPPASETEVTPDPYSAESREEVRHVDEPETAPHEDFGGKFLPRILMVDDDEEFLKDARELLERHYEVVTSTNGLTAINKVNEVEPDLFVLDGLMPKMSGFQMVDMLRGTPGTVSKPIVFLAGRDNERDRSMLKKKGVRNILMKPVEPQALKKEIDSVVERPDFEVKPKRRTIKKVLYDEGKKRAEHNQHTDKQKMWQSYNKLEGFLKNNQK